MEKIPSHSHKHSCLAVQPRKLILTLKIFVSFNCRNLKIYVFLIDSTIYFTLTNFMFSLCLFFLCKIYLKFWRCKKSLFKKFAGLNKVYNLKKRKENMKICRAGLNYLPDQHLWSFQKLELQFYDLIPRFYYKWYLSNTPLLQLVGPTTHW